MKNLLKKLSVLLILLFAALFYSCEKELYEEAIHSSKKIKITEVKFKELSKDQKFSNLISLINDNNVAGRSEFEDQYGFTISDGNVKIIETDTVTSYTMLILRDGVTDDSYFENLVFQEDIYNNRKVAIYKYTPNNITPTGHNSFHFDGTIDKFSLSNSSSLNRVSQQMSTMSDCYDYHLMCNYGGNEHPAGANCTRTYLKTFRVICASPSNGDGGDDGGGGGGGSGSGSPNDNPLEDNNDIITSPVLNNAFLDGIHYINQFNAENFYNNLTWQQQEWAAENPNEYDQIIQYLTVNLTNESEAFAKELMDLAHQDTVTDNNAFNFILQAQINNKIENDLDEAFLESVDQYIDLSTIDPIVTQQLIMYFSIQCAVLRYNHPAWSDSKIYWEASKEMVHITLDVLGLVPVFGEVADLTNGALYTIEGEGVNATLSFASAVPVAGWAAVGVKYAVKIKTVATIGTKVKLTWKVLADGTIYFGSNSTCRAQLRKVLGLAVGNLDQAHHIIPLNKQTKSIVQKASKSGSAFHMNEALNGIPLNNAVHNGSHANYDLAIQTKFDQFNATNATPEECYDFLTDLIQDVRTWIANNPNTPINQIILP